MLPEDNSILGNTVERNRAVQATAALADTQAQEEASAASSTPQIADSAPPQQQTDRIAPAVDAHTEAVAPVGKRDWL